MKLFKFEQRNDDNVIIEICENDITDITNSYGMWIESSRFELDESNFELNEDGTFDLTEYYNETDNLNLLPSEWDLRKLNSIERDIIIKLSNYSIDKSDEADSTTVYDINIDLSEVSETSEYFLNIQESEAIVVGKEYTYWDGNNWKDLVLSHDSYDVEIEDVSSEYENWEAKELMYSSEIKMGRSFSLYALNLDDNNVLVRKNETCWQGEFDTFEIITDSEEITILLESNNVDNEIIEQYFQHCL